MRISDWSSDVCSSDLVALARVGKALDAVRAAKKPVFAYATIYSDDSYQLAAHASASWVNPLGGVAITGRGGSGLYYKGLIDKLGVNKIGRASCRERVWQYV